MIEIDTSLSVSEMQMRKIEREHIVLESLSLKKEERGGGVSGRICVNDISLEKENYSTRKPECISCMMPACCCFYK